jgi:hypothetical protein
MLGRQGVKAARRVIGRDSASHHDSQPLADIAFGKLGGLGNSGAGAWRQLRHHVEQAGAVSD